MPVLNLLNVVQLNLELQQENAKLSEGEAKIIFETEHFFCEGLEE